MALVGNMIQEAIAGNHSSINFTMFVALFSMLSLFYLIAATVRESLAKPPMLPPLLDLVNTLLFLIAAIVLSAKLGVHSCGNDVCGFFLPHKYIRKKRSKDCSGP
jgi:predicted transporter